MTAIRRLNLALQGGGSHGAFTWGVLDALLEDTRIEIGWISGTSAGAVNAAAVASGLATAGRDGARATLARIWTGVVEAAVPDAVKLNPLLAMPWETISRSGTLAQLSTLLSPYEFNPFGVDPLRDLLVRELDIAAVRRSTGPQLLIAATDIERGVARLFRRDELSVEAVLASACLPTLHHAVDIEGRAYWDGGFTANPDLLTLAAESPFADTLIVQLAALTRSGRPTSAREISAHMYHLAFSRPYALQLERIVALQRRRGPFDRLANWATANRADARIGSHRFHLIDAGRHTSNLPIGSQAIADDRAVMRLFHAGRSEGAKWLERHHGDIGVRETANLAARLRLAQSGAA